ncbi:hypothetical protein CXF35_06570, partial [Corynebacterium bovis]
MSAGAEASTIIHEFRSGVRDGRGRCGRAVRPVGCRRCGWWCGRRGLCPSDVGLTTSLRSSSSGVVVRHGVGQSVRGPSASPYCDLTARPTEALDGACPLSPPVTGRGPGPARPVRPALPALPERGSARRGP